MLSLIWYVPTRVGRIAYVSVEAPETPEPMGLPVADVGESKYNVVHDQTLREAATDAYGHTDEAPEKVVSGNVDCV